MDPADHIRDRKWAIISYLSELKRYESRHVREHETHLARRGPKSSWLSSSAANAPPDPPLMRVGGLYFTPAAHFPSSLNSSSIYSSPPSPASSLPASQGRSSLKLSKGVVEVLCYWEATVRLEAGGLWPLILVRAWLPVHTQRGLLSVTQPSILYPVDLLGLLDLPPQVCSGSAVRSTHNSREGWWKPVLHSSSNVFC